MSTDSSIDALRRLKAAQERLVLVIGLTFGVLLILYFFTFAQLIDRGHAGLVWFQGLSAIAMVIALFTLKRITFVLIRVIYARPPYRDLLARIGPADLDEDPEKLLARLSAGAGPAEGA